MVATDDEYLSILQVATLSTGRPRQAIGIIMQNTARPRRIRVHPIRGATAKREVLHKLT